MLKKVYIGNDIDSNKQHIRTEFNVVNFISCSNLNLFISKHSKNLFDQPLTCFLDVDELDSKFLLDLLEKQIYYDVIWHFKSLKKNTKIYKKLDSITTLEFLNEKNLSEKNKKDLILKFFNKFNVDIKYVNLFLTKNFPSEHILYNEIYKFSLAEKLLDEPFLEKTIISYNSENDVMNFISALFTYKLETCYRLAINISENFYFQAVALVILKRIKSYIYLSIDDISSANSIWFTPPYYLRQNIKIAKDIGYNNLLNLYDFTFSNLYLNFNGNLLLNLINLIRYFNSLNK